MSLLLKIKISYSKYLFLAAVFFGLVGFIPLNQNDKLQEKFESAIQTTYEGEEFQQHKIEIPQKYFAEIPLKKEEGDFYKITSAEKTLGFAYLGTAPSKKKEFEYVVMFDENFIIKKSKVLIYREDYGLQIGSQRWLKQFIGVSPDTKLNYGENISGISGATISASSMTRSVNKVLQSIKVLQQEEII